MSVEFGLPQSSLAQGIMLWVRSALFNSNTPARYFEDLISGWLPNVSLSVTKAEVVSISDEQGQCKSWSLKPASKWGGFKSGQHVPVTVTVNGRQMLRTFSISSSESEYKNTGLVRLTIKRIPDGRVTNYLHSELAVGNTVELGNALGEFCIREAAPTLYLAAGSGITPIMSQLRELSSQGFDRSVELIYFARGKKDWVFEQELKMMAKVNKKFRVHLVNTNIEGSAKFPHGERVNASHLSLLKITPSIAYVCGPSGFFERAKEALVGIEGCQVVGEHFGLPTLVPSDDQSTAAVTFSASNIVSESNGDRTLLELAENERLSPVSGCRMGICHTCKCTKRSGIVKNIITGEVSDGLEQEIQPCISVALTDVDLVL